MAELDYIRWLRRQLKSHPRILLPPGDDTALIQTSSTTLMAADMLLEGVHFDRRTATAALIGRKALAVNLSDIAAMAGEPVAVTVSLGLPRAEGQQLAEQIFHGMHELATDFNLAVAGGDTNAWNGPLVIDVAIIGDAPSRGAVRRSGAMVGDWIFVSGYLGGSLAEHHLTFTPRVREAQYLHQTYGLNAMIDLSDGLATDLGHILAASQVGARLDSSMIPISPHLPASNQTKSGLEHALTDGEDFELCFTVTPSIGKRLLQDQPLASSLKLTKIGEIIGGQDYIWTDGTAILQRGFEHEL